MIPPSRRADAVKAFAPGNISGLFKIVANDDPAKMHSLGWGFTVSDGVTATLSVSNNQSTVIRFNGKQINFPTVADALATLSNTPIDVDIRASLPLSSGFGLSGASTYAALIAADELLRTDKTRDELALIAHVAEVKNLTGLGDVCAQHIGGCLVKRFPGDPLTATKINIEPMPIYWRYFSPISTREVLKDQKRHQQINQSADAALKAISEMLDEKKQIDFETLADIALSFATNSEFLTHPEVKRCVADARNAGGYASMIMLGNAVFSTVPFEGSTPTMLSETQAHAIST